MTSNVPPTAPSPQTVSVAPPNAANQAPSQIELLWDRYKSIAYVVIAAIVGAIVVNIGWKYYSQGKTNEVWSKFSATMGLDVAYRDSTKSYESLTDRLATLDAANLKAAAAAAPDSQRPMMLFAVAKKAVLDRDWAAAEAALVELETKYPKHSLLHSSPHPVQVQDPVKQEEEQTPQKKPQKPELVAPEAGSAVSRLRAEIATARTFEVPAHFAKTPIPENATKVKFEFGTYGAATIAFHRDWAPAHFDKIMELAKAEPPFWVGLAVDEIRRPGKFGKQPHELHFGFESTRGDDRTKWLDTEPSRNLIDFEKNNLSHFPGAVSMRNEADGKSCADRFWINLDDAAQHDGERVIVGFVVEGEENLRRICEATMTAQEEEQGRGKPTETIRITAVSVLQ